MMKKLDKENETEDSYAPLLSQHISIVEVGAYSKVFDKLLDFLDIRSLIITDIDSVKPEPIIKDGDPVLDDDGIQKMSKGKANRVSESTDTSNASIKHFIPNKSWQEIRDISFQNKIIRAEELCIVFQNEENAYHARSFEDSFIHLNRDFIKTNKKEFNSLKNIKDLDDPELDAYRIAENCIEKKTLFATDILYYAGNSLENWKTPNYIKEGLLWLSIK